MPATNPAPDATSTSARQLYRHATLEALLTVAVWLSALCWTVGYCWLHGYAHGEDSLWVRLGLAARQAEVYPLRFGMPNWVFWGVFFPWILCTLFTITLSFLLPDDPLESAEADARPD